MSGECGLHFRRYCKWGTRYFFTNGAPDYADALSPLAAPIISEAGLDTLVELPGCCFHTDSRSNVHTDEGLWCQFVQNQDLRLRLRSCR